MFLDKDFLLTNEFGKKLFHDYSQKMPIIDYHNHLDPKVIYENKNFEDLTQAWLYDNGAGDHYKWRLLRTEGFDESLITGDAPSYEKYLAFVKTLKKAMGNPIFEWSHLELRRYFGIEEVLTEENAKEIWDKANALLQTDDFKPRALLKRMNITAMCTTDDPIDDLNYHKLIKEEGIGFKVLPTFRPDFVFDIEGNAFVEYLEKLTNLTRYEVSDFSNLEKALDARVAYFHEVGGRLSDHGLNTFHYISTSQEEANRIMQKRLQGTSLTREEVLKYQSALQIALMKIYVKHGWAMQLHMNALRNDSAKSFKEVGINAGFDSMGDQTGLASEFVKCFSDAELENAVPKTVVYSLNENDYLPLATAMQSFQGGMLQKIQLGSGWWFNDTIRGMQAQLTIAAQQTLLGNFVGMLTDSRSLLSFPRHEYFRRILCDLVGSWVERGQIPDDLELVGKMIEDISYNNANEQFNF